MQEKKRERYIEILKWFNEQIANKFRFLMTTETSGAKCHITRDIEQRVNKQLLDYSQKD